MIVYSISDAQTPKVHIHSPFPVSMAAITEMYVCPETQRTYSWRVIHPGQREKKKVYPLLSDPEVVMCSFFVLTLQKFC